jgi:uncharacterized protein (TIGR00255 family)
MTGYGEASFGHIHCEVKSLNHRFLDISLSIPASFSPYEFKIRKLLSTHVKRGTVFLRLFAEDVEIRPDLKHAKAYYKFIQELKKELGLKSEVPIEPFLKFSKEKPPAWRDVKNVISTALEKLIKSRIQEGQKTKVDIELHLKKTKKLAESMKKRAPDQQKIEKELKGKLDSFPGKELDERKIREELTLLLIRENFNEEAVRLNAHIGKFEEVLRSKDPSGKHFAFLLQEMQREVNTVSAKAKNAAVSQLAVELKREMESLREQVENVR